MKATPLVSVIVASFNKAKYIKETLESVLRQTHASVELIVVDDHSNDGTDKLIIELAAKDPRVKFFQNKSNLGANYSRNEGIKKSVGEYIIFLDADDLLSPDCIEKRVLSAVNFPDSNLLVFSMGIFQDHPGDRPGQNWIPQSKDPLTDFLQHRLPWSIVQPMWRKDLLQQLGGFDESFQRLQDVELHTRALLSLGINYKQFVSEPDCFYRVDEARKNFNTFEFLKRWMQAAVQYCDKFEGLVPPTAKRFLFGTLLQSHQQLIYHLKQKKIRGQEFHTLEQLLFSAHLYQESGIPKKAILSLSTFYNRYFFRLPGVNRILSALVVK